MQSKTIKENWKGNSNSIYKTLGASNHTEDDRETYDFYATEPKAVELLLELERFSNVWECACRKGHISDVLKSKGIDVFSSDIIDRGYGEMKDFLCITNQEWNGDIITNPPYIYAKDFVLKSLQIIPEGRKIAMFLKLLFMESKDRKHLFKDFPPKTIYVSST